MLVFAAGWEMFAQEKTFHESVGVSLVQVPVYVTGRDGKPIRGLSASEFELDDEGARQQIIALDVVDLRRNRVEPGGPPTLPVAGRRHFLFLFDLSFASPNETTRSRDAALQFVGKGLEPEDLAAVATVSSEQGVRLLLTFTSDRRQMVEAIRSVGLPSVTDAARDPLAFAFRTPGDPQRSRMYIAEQTESGNQLDTFSTARIYSMLAQKTADQYAEGRVQRQLHGMGALARALDAVDGRKTIIYFSEGFDARLLVGNMARKSEDNEADNEAMLHGQFWQTDVDKRYANPALQGTLSATLAIFRRSDCTIYPIDIAGLRTDGDAQFGEIGRRGEESLFQIANETGGFVLRNANDLASGLDRIAEETSLTYILAYKPTKTLGPDRYHRLRVRVRVKGARVSARAGYYESKTFGAMSALERALAAADVITHEKRESAFPIEVLGIPLTGQPLSPVSIVIEMPVEELAGRASADRLPVGLYVYVTDDNGQLADYFTRRVSLDLTKQGENSKRGRFSYSSACHLLPGNYRIRAFVRNEADGRFAFRVVPLKVPAWGNERMWAYPPLFLAGERSVLSFRDAASRYHGDPNPLEIAGEGFVPLLYPTLATADPSRICLMLFQAGSEKGLSPFQLNATVVDPLGNERGTASVTVVGRSRPTAEGLMKLLIEFRPNGLAPGSYSLRFVFRDADGGSPIAETQAPFRIS
jgi:VWFA-related protein